MKIEMKADTMTILEIISGWQRAVTTLDAIQNVLTSDKIGFDGDRLRAIRAILDEE